MLKGLIWLGRAICELPRRAFQAAAQVDEGTVVVFDSASTPVGIVYSYRYGLIWTKRIEVWALSPSQVFPLSIDFRIEWVPGTPKDSDRAGVDAYLRALCRLVGIPSPSFSQAKVTGNSAQNGHSEQRACLVLRGNDPVAVLVLRRSGNTWYETAVCDESCEFPFEEDLTFEMVGEFTNDATLQLPAPMLAYLNQRRSDVGMGNAMNTRNHVFRTEVT